jgi:hypothetical protein
LYKVWIKGNSETGFTILGKLKSLVLLRNCFDSPSDAEVQSMFFMKGGKGIGGSTFLA